VIPAANQALGQVAQGFQAGTYTLAQAQAALGNLVSAFQNEVSSILKDDSSQCNAACVSLMCLQAAAGALLVDFESAAATGGPASSTALTGVGGLLTPGTPLPSWVPWLIAAEVLYLVLG